MKAMERSTIKTADVRADGMGLSLRAGTALLALVAERLGLADGCLASSRVADSLHCLAQLPHGELTGPSRIR